MKDKDETSHGRMCTRRQAQDQLWPTRDSSENVPMAEKAFYQEQEKYRVLVESAPLGIALIDGEGRYRYLNPKFVEMFGYTLDDIPTGQAWFARAYPDATYRRQIISDWKLYLQESQIGEGRSRIFTVTCKDGSAKVINFKPVSLEGGDQFLLYEDITTRLQGEEALKESEAKYRALVEQIPAITYTTTIDDFCTTTFISPQVEAILGFAPADFKTEPYTWSKQLHPEDHDWVMAEVTRCLEAGEPFASEYRMVARNGQFVWLRDQAQVVKDSMGRHLFLQGVMLDITEAKQAEEKLVQAKEEWERTFNAIPGLVMILDTQYRIVRANRAMALSFGYNPEEIEGKLCYEVVHGLEAPPTFCPCSMMLTKGQPTQLEMWSEKLQRFFLLNVSPIYDPSGRIMGSVQVGSDITDIKVAEEALRQSEANYRLLVEQIPALVFRGHEDWSIECFDNKVEALTGYSQEDFNFRLLTWRDLIPEEELPYVKQVFRKALKGDGSYFLEHRIRKKRGECAWVQCRGQIFCKEGEKVDYISGVIFDVTAKKQAEAALRENEELYQLITENVSDVIWTTNLDLKITYISPSIQQLLGFTPEEIKGKAVGEVFPPESLGVALEALSEEMAREREGGVDPKRTKTLEVKQCHKDGSIIWAELKASFIRDAYQQPIGILGVTRDITKRKKAEQLLHRREAILEAVSFATEKFLKTNVWEQDIQKILARLGQAVEVSRVYIIENQWVEDGTLLSKQRYEWVAPNINHRIDNPEFQDIAHRTVDFGRWQEVLSKGQIIGGPRAKFPPSEKESLRARDIKTLLVVPIFVGQQWWGAIGFDDCAQEREWSSMEIDALLTAASILGLTILHQKEEKTLRESEEKLRSLSYQLLTSQEQERKRFANELHDVLGHDLLIMKLELESLYDDLLPEHASQRKKVQKMIKCLQDSVKNVRNLYQDLRPGNLEDLGLTRALHLLVENFASAKKLKCHIDLDDIDNLFALPIKTAIYRVVQEALTNIGKHAEGNQVLFRAWKDAEVVSFTIEDNGKGLNLATALKAKKTLGLLSMEERIKIQGGAFEISNRKQGGTRVLFTIPLSGGGR